MTQEKIDKVFMSELGRQCGELFTTEDDVVFIRYKEAVDYSNESGLDVDGIEVWYPSEEVEEHDYWTENM